MTFDESKHPRASDGQFAKDPTFTGRQWKGQDVHALPLSGTGRRGNSTYDQSALAVHNHACVEDDASESGFKSICGKVKAKNILSDTSGGWADDPKDIKVTCPHCVAKLDKPSKTWAGKKLDPAAAVKDATPKAPKTPKV